MENCKKKTKQPILIQMCYVHMIFPLILRIQKQKQKQEPKKHSFRLLMTIPFRYHHYECFLSQIVLTKLNIVKGGVDNSLNKKCICLLDAAPLIMQQKCYFFFLKIRKNLEKRVVFCLNSVFFCFLWKLPLFSSLYQSV